MIAKLWDMFFERRLHVAVADPCDIGSAAIYNPTIVVIPRPELIEDLLTLSNILRALFPRAASAILIRPTDLRHHYLPYADRVYTDYVSVYRFLTEMFEVYEKKNGATPHKASYGMVHTDFRDRANIKFARFRFPVNVQTWMILRYLTIHAPREISAEELIATCFPRTRPVKKNTISAHISLINRVLSVASEGEYQPAVFRRGRGYSVR